MAKAVWDYKTVTGFKAGIKVAGGIRDSKDAIRYLVIVNEELGSEWLNPNSSLTITKYLIASLESLIPPATFIPALKPVTVL
jgi:deoxyribose-phosphate aldolase